MMRIIRFQLLLLLATFGGVNAAVIQFTDLAGFNGATVVTPGGQDFSNFDGFGTSLNIRGIGTYSGGVPSLADIGGDASFVNRMNRVGGGAGNVQSNILFFTITGPGATLDAVRTDNSFGTEVSNIIETLSIAAGGTDLTWSGASAVGC